MLRGDSLDGAIATSVAYLDCFACAPRAAEIHRFLVGYKATRDEVLAALANSPALRSALGEQDGFYFLRGKPHLVPRRVRFLEHSRRIWPTAHSMANTIAKSGLASAGMITGSLAADNADEHADVDFLFVYPSARAWTSYAALRLMAKVPGSGLGTFCPNYALPEDRLQVRPQNLFTAWEIAKAVPMFGFDIYTRFILENRWVAEMLPNALPLLDAALAVPPARSDPKLVRRVIDSAPFRWLEARERKRKWRTDTRDVGVDMQKRVESGSVDRHTPTRSFQALSELRYRMEMLGLERHALYPQIVGWTQLLDDEMGRWGSAPLPSLKPAGDTAVDPSVAADDSH